MIEVLVQRELAQLDSPIYQEKPGGWLEFSVEVGETSPPLTIAGFSVEVTCRSDRTGGSVTVHKPMIGDPLGISGKEFTMIQFLHLRRRNFSLVNSESGSPVAHFKFNRFRILGAI